MRDVGGNHLHPVVTAALPGSGVAGQVTTFQNVQYYWHTTFAMWVPFSGWFDIILGADYTNATTTLSTLFTFNVVANGIYEFDMLGHWRGSVTTLGMKLTLVTPAAALQQALATVSGVQAGVTAATMMELGISGTAQTGPLAGTAAVGLHFDAKGLIKNATTAGAVTIQAAASAAGTLTIPAGTRLRWRRLA